MKYPSPRRLSAAVLAGAIAFTGLGLAPAAMAAPAAEAASYSETITANVATDSGTGYGVESIYYSIDAYAGADYVLSGDNVYHEAGTSASDLRAYTFSVKLTDQPQVITQLIAKHKDNLAGADKLIQLENPLIVPAYQPWPPSVLTDEIVMPEIVMGVDSKGYTTFAYDASEIGTTSADLEREQLYLEAWIDGEKYARLEDGAAYRCDGPDSIFDGKKVELRALFASKTDGTARHNSVIVDCPANIPLSLKLGQEATSVKPGETVAFTIEEMEGTYGKDAKIAWSVDGRTVDGATGMTFQTPGTSFTAVQATVTIEDREGETLTRTIGWANPTPTPIPGEVEDKDPDTDKPGTDTNPDTGDKPDTGKTADDDDSPLKAECEGLCDGGGSPAPDGGKDIVDKFVDLVKPQAKPLTGQKKPADRITAPRVMSTLSR